MKNLRLLMIAGIAVFALTLAGCGGGGGGGSATPPADTPPMTDPAADERAAIDNAIMAAQAAVGMVDDMADDAAVDAANAAIMAAKAAIAGATSLPDAEKAAHGGTVSALETTLNAAVTSRMAYMTMQADEARTAMTATARKLYAGIGNAPLTFAGDGARGSYYTLNDESTITVSIDDAAPGDGTDVDQILTEDKKAMVADNYGWAGKRYTASGTGVAGTYEAIVYSDVEAPTQGAKFNSGTGAGNVGFDTTAGVLTINAAATNVATRIASPSFDHSAGRKTFKLPDPNPGGATRVTIAGSYYGVAGTYTCTPGTGSCVVNRAANGYTLGLGAGATSWTFTATNPDARVTDVPDAYYASYGWWILTAEDGKLTVSVFTDDKDGSLPQTNVPDARGLQNLYGTATYSGGAVGMYALSSSTGGMNDAGHFTAVATLEADFTANMITGTIDNFMGADGMSRDWSVEMMKQTITSIGRFNGTDGAGLGGASKTKWTIDGTAGSASGQWAGGLKDNGDDGIPKVAVGTFYSEFGQDGRMVGAFGANRQ